MTELSLTRLNHTGELQSVDGYMNIALEKTEEFVNGVKRRTYGDAFVRGNNGQFRVHASWLRTKSAFANLYLQSCISQQTEEAGGLFKHDIMIK